MKRLLALLAFGLLGAPAAAQMPETGADAAAPAPVDYADAAHWLCLPGRADACGQPLPTADLNPDGYGAVAAAAPAADPPIDCFYVYPTVSRDAGMNSDLDVGPAEEAGAAAIQFARFATLCKPYAPVYRQATMASLAAVTAGRDVAPIFALAYGDVRAAWRYYLEHYNRGRPFVLIGHSQGSIHLETLIAREIEGRPEARRMLSAILLGWAVEVPEGGALVGGSFRSTPLCTRMGETGCVISYMSFRAASPPPAGSLMGRATHPGMTAGCTNPAALGSDAAQPLDSYWFARSTQPGTPSISWSSTGAPPAPFLHTEGLVSGQCRHDGPAGWLAIGVNADPNDARTDEVPGDVPIPGWGMHLVDMNVAQGDLLRLVAAQRDAWVASHR
jgi:hypothetical protein